MITTLLRPMGAVIGRADDAPLLLQEYSNGNRGEQSRIGELAVLL